MSIGRMLLCGARIVLRSLFVLALGSMASLGFAQDASIAFVDPVLAIPYTDMVRDLPRIRTTVLDW